MAQDKYGYKSDPGSWEKDASFATDLFPKLQGAIPWQLGPDEPIDLRRFCTETNQGSLSSCAGNATADAVEIAEAIEEAQRAEAESRTPRKMPQLSRLFVYALARNLRQELGKDEGSYIRDNFEILSRNGICTEETWPYDEAKVFVAPSFMAMREAAGHRIHSYYRIKSEGGDRIDEVKAALHAYHPVVFGTNVEQAFINEVHDLTPVGPPQVKTIGGHAMVIVGWLPGQGFLVKNSWGAGWGERGFCILKESFIAWEETRDLWVPTLGGNFLV